LTAHATGTRVNPIRRIFTYYVREGWSYNPGSLAWSLAPPNQVFQLDWGTYNVQASPANLTYTSADDSKPTASADLVNISGPTLDTQLIYDQMGALSLASAFQPQGVLGVSVAPGSVRLPCALARGAAIVLGPTANTYDLLLAAETAASTVAPTTSAALATIKKFPGLFKTAKSAASAIQNAAYNYVYNACFSAIRQVELGEAVVGVAVVIVGGVIVTAPVAAVIGAVGALVGTLVATQPKFQPAAVDARARGGAIGVPAATPPERLHLSRLRLRGATGLRAAPLRRREIGPFVKALEVIPAAARVGRLVVSGSFKGGAHLVVLGARLPQGTRHRAILIVRGPGYEGESLLVEKDGLVGAVLTLPHRLRRGLWAIAIIDNSNVRLVRKRPHVRGWAQVRLGVFHVAAPAHG
jgi:hypothetical protein